ncbi:hypothetical protein V8E55_003943 [Tylopilus felleus]
MSVVTLLQDAFVLRAVAYGSYALLVWDYFLTLDDEMAYIWASRPSIVKYLFIGNRYINLFTQPFYLGQLAGTLPLDSTAACLAFSWAFALSRLWSYDSVHLLVLLRVWILYGRTLGITVALLVQFILYLGASIAFLLHLMSAMHFRHAGEDCLLIRIVWANSPLFDVADSSVFFAFVPEYDENMLFFRRIGIILLNITGQRLAIDLRRLQIQRDISPSEVSREVEIQLAAFDDDPAAPTTLSTVEFP